MSNLQKLAQHYGMGGLVSRMSSKLLEDLGEMSGKMTREQLVATLKNKGVKDAELEAAKLGTLPEKTSAEQALNHAYEHYPQLEETIRYEPAVKNADRVFEDLLAKYGQQFGDKLTPEESKLFLDTQTNRIFNGALYPSYTLPGGYNYREALLQLPEDFNDGVKHVSAHWHQPNVVAHMRLKDHETPNGSLLFADEIQSDWRNDLARPDRSAPPMPWEKNWHELALRRGLQEAADSGYDNFGWAASNTHNNRFLLNPRIDRGEIPNRLGQFYDNILPNYSNKFLKQYGSSVVEGSLPGLNGEGAKIFTVPITDALRSATANGKLRYFTAAPLTALGLQDKGDDGGYFRPNLGGLALAEGGDYAAE